MLTEEIFNKDKHIVTVGSFSCTKEIMETYIKQEAFKETVYKNVNIYLVYEDDAFAGYYGIKNRTIVVDDLNGKKRTINCVELECIAVDVNYARKGIGTEIFYRFILPKCVEMNDEEDERLLVLFTLDNESTAFYNSLGFEMALQEDMLNKYIIYPDDFSEGLQPMVFMLPIKENFDLSDYINKYM